jgi:hypothetical protein
VSLETVAEGRVLSLGDLDALGDGGDAVFELAGAEEEPETHAAKQERGPPGAGEDQREGVDEGVGRLGLVGQSAIDLGDAPRERVDYGVRLGEL